MPKNEKKWTWLNKTCIHKAIISLWIFLGSWIKVSKIKTPEQNGAEPFSVPTRHLDSMVTSEVSPARTRSIHTDRMATAISLQWMQQRISRSPMAKKSTKRVQEIKVKRSDDRLVVIRNHKTTPGLADWGWIPKVLDEAPYFIGKSMGFL